MEKNLFMSIFKKFQYLVIIGLLVVSSAYASTISLGTISADATTGGFNDNFTTIANVVNGDIEGSEDGTSVTNIKADSVYEINMADDANPRVRDAELLAIGADSVSSGTLTQATVVESGCVPADDTDLTSDISACVAYVNGYRVSKSATALTYTASRDNYVDLSQSGVYTITPVTLGATQPAVAANSSRLAKVVTDGTEITTITSTYTTRIPGLIIPSHYRDGLIVSKDSATTITILPGTAEINNAMVSKTSSTTLTVSTAGDWAGGSSLQAADTYGYVGVDTSGNLKLHTTAPTHDNFAVSTTAGKKRYATWSSTVYRILGWFYMNGAQNIDNASNIKEGGTANVIISSDTNVVSFASTSFSSVQDVRFYSSGGPILVMNTISGDNAGGTNDRFVTELTRGGTRIPGAGVSVNAQGANLGISPSFSYLHINQAQGTHQYGIQAKVAGNSVSILSRQLIVAEE